MEHASVAPMFQFDGLARIWGWSFGVLGSLLVFGCDSESPSNGANVNGSSSGQVTELWSGYCAATFTSDVVFKDGFGDVAFTARSGEKYLLTQYDTSRVEIAYLTPLGPDTYEVPVTGGPETFPFTSNCAYDAAVEYYAVFTDIVVYDSEALTNQICSLPVGTAVVLDMAASAGSSITDLNITLSGPETYEIALNALGAQCGGAERGYVSVPQTTVLGVHTWLVPVTVVLKPQ
jgi:hypothetical protein